MKGIKFKTAVNLGKNGTLRKYNYSDRDDRWEVIEEFYWWLDYVNQVNKIIVPNGFVTDFGSIPGIIQLFVYKYRISFILHDMLYEKKYNLFTRKEADLILLEALTVEGVGIIERNFIYFGVRLFGFKYFYKI